MRTAKCTCGQLQVHCEGEPVRVSLCHCLNCQRRTGSAFAIQARFPLERVTHQGTASEYTLTGDEGTTATFRFCATCGAMVYFTNATMPDLVAVPVGAFADPTFPAPMGAIYDNRRHPWLTLDPAVKSWD